MLCHVYRSSARDGLYVYVAAVDGEPRALEELPAPVRRQLGRAELAMTLELDASRRLGQEDAREVLANLAEHGFHVQMPRDIEPAVRAIADAVAERAASRESASPPAARRGRD